MNEKEILEYNKLCVEEALGLKCSVNGQYELPKMMIFPPKKGSNLCYTAKVCCVEDMQFHSDWNWIMEVVEAIEKLTKKDGYGYEILITNSLCVIEETNKIFDSNQRVYAKTTKEAVVQAINQFLIWYEQNK